MEGRKSQLECREDDEQPEKELPVPVMPRKSARNVSDSQWSWTTTHGFGDRHCQN